MSSSISALISALSASDPMTSNLISSIPEDDENTQTELSNKKSHEKDVQEEALSGFTLTSTRAEVRQHLLFQYGRNQNKALLEDRRKHKGSKVIGLKCRDCETFKLQCNYLKLKGGWKIAAKECNLNHDSQCNGAYRPSLVSKLFSAVFLIVLHFFSSFYVYFIRSNN